MKGPYVDVEAIKNEGAELQLRDALRMHLWHIRDLCDKARVDDYVSFTDRMDEILRRIEDARKLYDAATWPHDTANPKEAILP